MQKPRLVINYVNDPTHIIILIMGGGGGPSEFFGSEILAKSDFLGSIQKDQRS